MFNAIVEEITPEVATQYLAMSKGNRKLSTGAVNSYARDMKSGAYDLTHQGIAFFDDGSLADGHHRLEAIKKSGVTVQMLVVRGVARSKNIDRTRPRTIACCLSFDQDTRWIDKGVIAAISAMKKRSADKETVESVLDIALRYEDEIKFCSGLVGCRRKGVSHASVLAAVILACIDGVDRRILERFYEVLKSGVTTEKSDVAVIKLRDFLFGLIGASGGGQVRREILLRAQRAIAALVKDEVLSRLYVPSEPIYPLIDSES